MLRKGPELIPSKPPETADEFLAAGVDLEEAGEKWRAGDAAKASRFFLRAIEMYDEGLSIFSGSFDMEYNKYVRRDILHDTNLRHRHPIASA